MKILHFFKTYYPVSLGGGIEQFIFQLSEGGFAHGVNAETLYLSPQGPARCLAVGRHYSHASRLDLQVASTGFSLSAFKDFSELAREADIVHYHFPWPFADVVHFATCLRKPTVVSYHSDIVRQKFLLGLYRPLMHRFLGSVDRIVVSSPNYLESSPVLARYRDKLSVIPIGLDKDTYPQVPPEKLAFWRSVMGERFFLFVGRLCYYKGLDYLLEAAAKITYPIAIVGVGNLEASLKAKAERLGLTHVHFLGGLADVDKAALLQLCYSMVFPSHLRSEAFGIALLEAAMFGKAMISCEIGTGTSYINIAGETGLVVPPADPAALACAMTRLWGNAPRTQEMGARAQLRFEQLFTAKEMVRGYVGVYQKVLSNGRMSALRAHRA
ncbi:glycosyl transferase family 1 [Pseudomonas agarici]|uniref:Glycosyl transferase family 1 n=1 Tax=Pseudomonas agarici TaxID=46677 RepID=A0A0X1T6F0_PSEAA|nr:glycosyltransferase family 4 protein [Pseudomonas agarici]AMB87542.1 glycosyl transferase family 1 [Pseudomonas agarici]NWB90060.1 glycosyltransferase [Pseudomonas agarici]NWC08162.1 glycosyltransferase [Pseudomonas agarici]SEK85161.1 rhamnosyl/mannosyltransferase [Pseudomonas agarici]